jgi:hypothetical protein
MTVSSCRADIEAYISQLESPLPDFDLGQVISRSELKVEEVRAHLLARTSPTDQSKISPTCYGLAIISLLSSVPRCPPHQRLLTYRNPILTFTIFALFNSVVWHSTAGCARHRGMTLCAKINYVRNCVVCLRLNTTSFVALSFTMGSNAIPMPMFLNKRI